jgi:probable rRNA maturation factor
MPVQLVNFACSLNLEDAGSDPTLQGLLASDALERVITRTLEAANVTQPVTLSLLITGDEEIQTLNRQYRQQDKPTDVLSFPLLDRPIVDAPADQLWIEAQAAGEEGIAIEAHPMFVTPPELATNLGDIVVSWPTVLRQAAQAGHDPAYELLYLLSHGTLHLVGYDDQTEAGYQAMTRLQEMALQETERKAHS